ncbi:hypothetical protein E3T55_04600 [Cryobacterium frigoriphilum]|uniref:Uncharacterized protein n=1 Tax=Cryobacterium frigoriphilum TaxID=1259150 RepID=A0A4V3IRY6_9MICO|nr:hypothetical protein [Cryobacterium frigoriphilum]TFD53973.1 hypothetical protein E3T55_04600 [Cryobacterium frigoriphilum]
MDDNLKLLVLDLGEHPPASQADDTLGRALDTVAEYGVEVHQSSGRILVVDAPDLTQADLQEAVPAARLLPLDADIPDLFPPLDESETLFVAGLRISTSAGYRREKAAQKPGESPEEQLMFTAPCMPGGENNG